MGILNAIRVDNVNNNNSNNIRVFYGWVCEERETNVFRLAAVEAIAVVAVLVAVCKNELWKHQQQQQPVTWKVVYNKNPKKK